MIEIRTVKHEEACHELTGLYISTFKVSATSEFWEWKYILNPAATDIPEVTVALDGSKIVGARPFMLNQLWLGNQKIVAAQHCDTMVHKDYRRQGIFNRMGKFALQLLAERGYALTYGFPAPMSRKGFASQGYQRLMDTEILFKLINPVDILENKIFNTRAEQPDAASNYQVEIHDKYTDELGILDSLRQSNIIDIVRSKENLCWRFDSHPSKSYRYLLAKKHGQVQGYAVISIQKFYRNLKSGIIIDYLVKDNDVNCFNRLASRAIKEFQRAACSVAAIWSMCDPDLRQELLTRSGFKSSLNFPYKKVLGASYMDLIVIDKNRNTTVNLYDKTRWRVTYAYPNFT
jgi:GNAT superfamily N-acetyltransferase